MQLINDLYVCVHTHRLICYSQNIVSITTQEPLTRQTANQNPRGGKGKSGPAQKGLAFVQGLQDDDVEGGGEDAGEKLREEEVVAKADGAVALVLGKPVGLVFSNPLHPWCGWHPLQQNQVLSRLSS